MTNPITFKHSYNCGDLLTILPGVQKLYKETGRKAVIYQRLDVPGDYGHRVGHPVQTEGIQVCMNRRIFDQIKPLIEHQQYISEFKLWQGETVDINIDLTRHHTQMPLPGGSIHHWPSLIYPQLESDLSLPWLKIKADEHTPNIIINRTARYRNPYITYFFLKPFEGIVKFVGTEIEHETFCRENDLNVERLRVNNFLELAVHIKKSKFFVGNQSMCWHIADGMKHKRILEVCTEYPNTFPTGKNGHSFLIQNALEYQFNLLNEQ